MYKKIISIFTLIVFVFFTLSCAVYRKGFLQDTGLKKIPDEQKRKLKILSVLKTNGELIVFSKKNPGVFVGETIEGFGYDQKGPGKLVIINFSEIRYVKYKKYSPGGSAAATLLLVGTVVAVVVAAPALIFIIAWRDET